MKKQKKQYSEFPIYSNRAEMTASVKKEFAERNLKRCKSEREELKEQLEFVEKEIESIMKILNELKK